MNTPKLPTIRRTTNSTRPHSRKSGALASNRTRQRDPTDPIGQPARGFETYRIPYGETPAYASATRWILSPAGFGALPVFDGTGCGHSTAGRAVQKALMDQKGLNDVFQGALVLSDRRGQGRPGRRGVANHRRRLVREAAVDACCVGGRAQPHRGHAHLDDARRPAQAARQLALNPLTQKRPTSTLLVLIDMRKIALQIDDTTS